MITGDYWNEFTAINMDFGNVSVFNFAYLSTHRIKGTPIQHGSTHTSSDQNHKTEFSI